MRDFYQRLFHIEELEEGVGSSVVVTSHTSSADFSLSSQNSGFHNNPVKTYLQQPMHTVAANFCVALPSLSKLLTASWLLETVADTSLVSSLIRVQSELSSLFGIL